MKIILAFILSFSVFSCASLNKKPKVWVVEKKPTRCVFVKDVVGAAKAFSNDGVAYVSETALLDARNKTVALGANVLFVVNKFPNNNFYFVQGSAYKCQTMKIKVVPPAPVPTEDVKEDKDSSKSSSQSSLNL